MDVFDDHDLAVIRGIAAKIPKQPHPDADSVYTNGFMESDPIFLAIKQLVIDPINRRTSFPIKRVRVGMVLQSRNPFRVHSDAFGKGDSGRGHAFLIPLDQQGDITQSSSTIVFQQQWSHTQDIEDYIQSDPQLPMPDCSDIWEQHLDHNPKEWCRYLSVETLGTWIPGCVITWDRGMLHCSDNFVKKGIIEKTALILFTSDE